MCIFAELRNSGESGRGFKLTIKEKYKLYEFKLLGERCLF